MHYFWHRCTWIWWWCSSCEDDYFLRKPRQQTARRGLPIVESIIVYLQLIEIYIYTHLYVIFQRYKYIYINIYICLMTFSHVAKVFMFGHVSQVSWHFTKLRVQSALTGSFPLPRFTGIVRNDLRGRWWCLSCLSHGCVCGELRG